VRFPGYSWQDRVRQLTGPLDSNIDELEYNQRLYAAWLSDQVNPAGAVVENINRPPKMSPLGLNPVQAGTEMAVFGAWRPRRDYRLQRLQGPASSFIWALIGQKLGQ